MKNLKTDPHAALKRTKILFYVGLAFLLLGLAVSGMMDASHILGGFAVCGIVMVVAGLVVGFTYVKCPYCDGSLMLGGRIPGSLPNYCPHCGGKL